jgi:hypothetical protein
MALFCAYGQPHTLVWLLPFFTRFEAIESAEKCIEALRRYRNLHPSFCKAGHISLYTCRPSITTPFRTSTPFQALVMHLSQPLGHSLPSLHRPERMATPSSHEWNVSKTSQAQTCTLKVFLCKSTNLYAFLIACYVLVINHFLLANLDSGCLSGPLHDQK